MRDTESTQLNIGVKTKNSLDLYKAQNKEIIIRHFKKKRRMVTNNDVISFLLYKAGVKK